MPCGLLLQGSLIYSPDRTAALFAYYTGKLLLVNTASYANDPNLVYPAKTVIWSSGTSGGPTPMHLVMQSVRASDTGFGVSWSRSPLTWRCRRGDTRQVASSAAVTLGVAC